jgi:hypothetical protein
LPEAASALTISRERSGGKRQSLLKDATKKLAFAAEQRAREVAA